jgi:hypothetical protein
MRPITLSFWYTFHPHQPENDPLFWREIDRSRLAMQTTELEILLGSSDSSS